LRWIFATLGGELEGLLENVRDKKRAGREALL
jgi:hypothetical protein